jgi:hypothetical protein
MFIAKCHLQKGRLFLAPPPKISPPTLRMVEFKRTLYRYGYLVAVIAVVLAVVILFWVGAGSAYAIQQRWFWQQGGGNYQPDVDMPITSKGADCPGGATRAGSAGCFDLADNTPDSADYWTNQWSPSSVSAADY